MKPIAFPFSPGIKTGWPWIVFILAFQAIGLHAQGVKPNLVLTFESGSSMLNSSQIKEVHQLANRNSGCYQIIVAGHADNLGNPSANLERSQERAMQVANTLLERNVVPAQIVLQIFGSSSPVGSIETEAGRALNRRVEVWVEGNPRPGNDLRSMDLPMLQLPNGTSVKAKQMTSDGERPIKLVIIQMEKEEPQPQDLPPLPPSLRQTFFLPLTKATACYRDGIEFEDGDLNLLYYQSYPRDAQMISMEDETGHFFRIELKDTISALLDFNMNNRCFEIKEGILEIDKKISYSNVHFRQNTGFALGEPEPIGKRSFQFQYVEGQASNIEVQLVRPRSWRREFYSKYMRIPASTEQDGHFLLSEVKYYRKRALKAKIRRPRDWDKQSSGN